LPVYPDLLFFVNGRPLDTGIAQGPARLCEKLAAEFSGEFTTRNIREITEEIESQLRALQK
jgi:hypothetical protein